MPASATLTVRLSTETKARLAELAEKTRRTSSFLASDAIAAYVDRELEIVRKIEVGLADVAAGRYSTDKDVFARIDAMLVGAVASAPKKRA